MGSSGSKPKPEEVAKTQESFDWPPPPQGPSAEEQDGNELVLQAWASCKSKPQPTKLYRSDIEEKERRETLAWRKRASFIELDCGDDSFFVSNTYKTIGVADGVGGWRDEGVDPSLFANVLMRNAKWFSETHRDVTDPEVIIDRAFEKAKHDGDVPAGSSTACCATLRQDAEGNQMLDVANLGDSGVIVIRNQEIIHRVHEKVHGFNCPFQLSILPAKYRGRCYADSMRSAVRETIPVEEGDVIVLGTDGLFDNRFCSHIANEAGWIGACERSPYDGIPLIGGFLKAIAGPHQRVEYTDPYRVAQRIVQDAYKTSVHQEAATPWASALQDFGVKDAKGGKADDITVVVSRVLRREEAKRTTMW